MVVIIKIFFTLLCLERAFGDTGFFWHVTDMHWDPTYSPTERGVSCGEGPPDGGQFGPYGDYLCDSPWNLINSSVQAMKDLKPDVDFLIWTGDDTPHNANLTLDDVADIISNLTTLLYNAFPNTTFYPVLGNHDWSPKHALPVYPPADPFYGRVADMWEPWLGDSTAPPSQQFRQGGFYSMNMSNVLLLVGLNTNLYYRNNPLTATIDDPSDQMKWLDETLTAAANRNQKVMLIGHVPPGQFEKHRNTTWFRPQFNSRFISLLRKHSVVISSAHFAHHHTDSFRIVYDTPTGKTPVTSFFIAPAVTPWETTLPDVMGGAGNNPGIRLVEYDRTTGHIINIHQYYLNLTAANQKEAKWVIAYDATTYFGIKDGSTAALSDLAEKIWASDESFEKYYKINGLYFPEEDQWTHEYKVVHYCAITRLDVEEYQQCLIDRSHAPMISAGLALLALCQLFVMVFYH